MFNDSQNSKLLIQSLEERIGKRFSCKKMISTKKESDIDFVKSFQKCGVKFLEKGFKCKTIYCSECDHKNDI